MQRNFKNDVDPLVFVCLTYNVRLWQVLDGLLDYCLDLLELLLELGGELRPLPPLDHQHHPEGLPRLVRPELVDEMVHVDEQQVDLLDLLLPLRGLGAFDQNVYDVQKIHQH